MIGHCHSDWVDPKEMKKKTDYVLKLANASISGNNVKHKCIAQSSVEAEYYATFEATKEAIQIIHVYKKISALGVN